MPRGIYTRKKRVEQKPTVLDGDGITQPWTPTPQIEPVKTSETLQSPESSPWVEPVVSDDGCANCPHSKETHYGPYQDWCNIHACKCERFAVKP